jgi:hypothetical protein
MTLGLRNQSLLIKLQKKDHTDDSNQIQLPIWQYLNINFTAVATVHIVTCIPIARQRLCKHVLSVNTPQQQRGCFLYGMRRDRCYEDKTQRIYFSRSRRPPVSHLTLNGRNIPFVNSAKYIGVIFDKRLHRDCT